ncbi:hypothetical protein [Nocardia sp. CS682]|uniref:hypothetical protein n=1 Tax=Nocardia sp. CS682 TaxID=1047172 RepID=UPI0010756F62|nr:hypothetical protein [Nocardia sp. CS682]QBS40410.1 hypothetical protein DMB37_10060 [Nocardia sp. CS682]
MPESSDAADTAAYLAAAEQLILALPDGEEFINADIQQRMVAAGWAELLEPRRMGGVLLALKRQGHLTKIGMRSSPARSHGGLTSVWRRTYPKT